MHNVNSINCNKNIIELTLPNEVVNRIASFVKPKNLLVFSLISKEIRSAILSDRDFWSSHVIRRWGGVENAISENQKSSLPNVLEKIKEYTIKHRLEKSALRYLSLCTQYDEGDLFKWGVYDFNLSVILHLTPYLERESSPKASFLYLAGHLGSHIIQKCPYKDKKKLESLGLRFERCLSWLEKAAEKGHMQAAFELAFHLIDAFENDDINHQDPITQAIKWLQTAADNNHQIAINHLKEIKDQNWSVVTFDEWDLDDLSEETKSKITELVSKETLEDSKKGKLSVSSMPAKIETVSIDRLQESALEYFSLLTKYDDPFSLSKKWGYNYQISIILHLSSYLKRGSTHAELFYLAGHYGIEIAEEHEEELISLEKDFCYEQCLEWLEKAAEMGHTQAAFELAFYLIDGYAFLEKDLLFPLTRAMKWLLTAAKNKHHMAINRLQDIENQNWENVALKYGDTMDRLPHEIKAEITRLIEISMMGLPKNRG